MLNNGINKRQNAEHNIDLLSAQRQLYFEAKIIAYFQLFSCVLIPLILPFLKKLCSNSTKQLAFISLFAILIVILNFFLEKGVKFKKEKAAKIQEIFDTDVLRLNWNNELCGSKYEALKNVKIKAKKYKKRSKSLNKVLNWYSEEYSTVDIYSGRIMCQRVNISWDREVRQNYQKCLLVTLIICSFLLFVFAIFENKPFSESMISIVAPLFPIVFYIFIRYYENKNTIIRLEKLNDNFEILWDQVIQDKTSQLALEKGSRKLQNEIYKHRCNALMIWDWFYELKRPNQESDMQEIAKNIVNDYKKVKSIM